MTPEMPRRPEKIYSPYDTKRLEHMIVHAEEIVGIYRDVYVTTGS